MGLKKYTKLLSLQFEALKMLRSKDPSYYYTVLGERCNSIVE
jgi:hypothetical protein